MPESDGSVESLKLEGLTVVDSLTAQLVLETLMIPMMIQYQNIRLSEELATEGYRQVQEGTRGYALGCSENIKNHIFYKPDSNYGALIYME